MLTSHRASIVVGLTVIAVFAGAIPAFADIYGSVDCDRSPTPDCELSAGSGGSGGEQADPGHGAPQPGRTGLGSGNGSSGHSGDTVIGESNLASCSYVLSDYQSPSGVVPTTSTGPLDPGGATAQPAAFTRPAATARAAALSGPVAAQASEQDGAWYVWRCAGPGVADALYRPPVWIPSGQPGAAQLPSPAEVAAAARSQLRLPSPAIAVSPAGDQLVHLPTWLWLSGGWGPVSATASVPGVSVTATARPSRVVWSMGEGSTVTCAGAGTPFRPGSDPEAPSPDCGHTYRVSSAGQPAQVFPVTATVYWTVTWSGAGRSGTFPDLTTTGTAALRVAEVQALNHGGGG